VRAFAEDAVREIDLACAGADVTLRKETSAGWRITRPIEAEADPRRVHEVVAALQQARVRRVIADKPTELGAFGLSPAACTVTVGFAAGTPALRLRLGRGSPVGTERYAAGEDARVVFTEASLYGAVSRGVEGFREKRLVPSSPRRSHESLSIAPTAASSSHPPAASGTSSLRSGSRVLGRVWSAGPHRLLDRARRSGIGSPARRRPVFATQSGWR
jgi:hypothetical protein